MKIAFDGTTLQPRRTGVGYYTEHLLHHLAANVDPGDLVVVSNRFPDLTRPLPPGVTVAAAGASLVRMVWLLRVRVIFSFVKGSRPSGAEAVKTP